MTISRTDSAQAPLARWFVRLRAKARKLLCSEMGGVSTLVAISLPVLIGSVGLGFDLNHGYNQRVMNQRVADMAALGAAMEYRANSGSDINAVARTLALANGLADAQVQAELLQNFPDAGKTSIRVTITHAVPFTLASVLGFSGSYNVAADSAVIVNAKAAYGPPCIMALSGASDALKMNGGTAITATECSVAAVGDISVLAGATIDAGDVISGEGGITLTGGAAITANSLRYADGLTAPNGTTVPAPKNRHNASTQLTDPWAGNAELAKAVDLLGYSSPFPTLSGPNVAAGGEDWTFGNATTQKFQMKDSSGNYIWGRYNVPKGNYAISTLSIGGGMNVTFENGSRLSIPGNVNIGAAVNFGDADIYVNGTFKTNWNTVTLGKGALWIGGNADFSGTFKKGEGDVTVNGTATFSGSPILGAGDHAFRKLSLGGGTTLTLGDGDLTVLTGISLGGGVKMYSGKGDYLIGNDSSGYAINLGGGAVFTMGDGAFSAVGNIATAGGSTLQFGAALNHYIVGNLALNGSVVFGSGRYTVDGDFINDTGGSMTGSDVTFILSGKLKLNGGTSINLNASDGTVAGGAIASLLFHSDTTSSIDWGGGSSNVFDGVVHFPNATVNFSGGNKSVDQGGCFMLIASKINATGGTTTGSACVADLDGSTESSDTNTTLKLVQ